jgi:ABC-2 type transport system permease protein
MRNALHAEWTKLRSEPGTGWLLLATVVLTVALSAVVADATAGAGGDAVRLSLSGVDLGQAVVAVLAVVAMTGEYGTGMISVTLAAMPRRSTLLAAKAAVVGAVTVAAGTLAVLGCLLVGRLVLPAGGLAAPPGDVLRAAAGSVLYLGLVALLGLGVAAAVRDAAAAIGGVLGLLYLFPVMAQVIGDPVWQRHLRQIGPMTAGLAIQATTSAGSEPIGPWAGLGVIAAWTAAAILAGGLLLRLRDA